MLLEVQSTHKPSQPIFPFVNEAGLSNAQAILKPTKFGEGVQRVQTRALQLENEEANLQIQPVSQRSWCTWERQGIYGVQNDVGLLILPIVVHL